MNKEKQNCQHKTSAVKLYFHYISVKIRCMMQYKKSFILTSLGQFLSSFNAFVGIFFFSDDFTPSPDTHTAMCCSAIL